jgi:peroxin-10
MSTPFWEWGFAPDKILQQTKDDHIVDRLGIDVQNIVTKFSSAKLYENWAPEFEVISKLLYFLATRVGGRQTLGEEYTDLQVVVSSSITPSTPLAELGTVRLPTLHRLGIFALLSIGAPYIYERLQRGAATYNSNTQRRLRQRQRYQKTHREKPPSTMLAKLKLTMFKAKKKAISSFWTIISSCLEPTSTVATVAFLAYELHRMVFFIRSDYLSLPMRLTGLRQIVNREFRDGRASYSILGMLLLVRMMIGASRSTYLAAASLVQYVTPSSSKLEADRQAAEEKLRKKNTYDVLVPSALKPMDADSLSSSLVSKDGSMGDDSGSELQCLLCMEMLDRPTLTPCGHLFCWDCVVPWCSKKSTCPLCRQSSSPQQLWLIEFQSMKSDES